MEHTDADPTFLTSDISVQNATDSSIPEDRITTAISPNVSQNAPSQMTLSEQVEQAWNAAIDAPEDSEQALNIPDMSGSFTEQDSSQGSPPSNPTYGLRASVGFLLNRCIDAITSSIFNHREAHPANRDDTMSENTGFVDPASVESNDMLTPNDHNTSDPEPQSIETSVHDLNSNNEMAPTSPQSTSTDASSLPRPPSVSYTHL